MKIRKGDYGYIRREKKKRLLVTLGLFVLPAIVFIVGLVLADGNKSNIFTVVAVVGCLPGCRAAVGFIMMVMQKPVDKAVYDAIEAKKGKLLMGYEMYKNGQEFVDGDGIIVKGIDGVFRNIGELATEGMNETNKTIIKMMTRTKC